jgi:hypothetical protein
LVLAGAVAFAGTTGGFTATAADRTATVTLADDANAYLGVVDDTDVTGSLLSFSSGESVTVYYLDDNVDAYDTNTTDEVSAELVAFGDDADPNMTVDVTTSSDGYDWQVELRCGNEDRDLDSGYATIEITASSDVTVVAERTTNNQVNPNCAS